jgi:hypothetical protein
MISEQTAAGAQQRAPGRSTLTETEAESETEAEAEQDAEQQAEAPQPETRPRSVFDLPFANDVGAEREVAPDGDD